MIVHPNANRAFWLSLISIALLLSSIISLIMFFRTTSITFTYSLVISSLLAITTSIFSIVYSRKSKKEITLHPNQFTGKEKSNAALVLGIIGLALNVLFSLAIILIVYFLANIYK